MLKPCLAMSNNAGRFRAKKKKPRKNRAYFIFRASECQPIHIDLKIGSLTHQDLGQMQMYVNLG